MKSILVIFGAVFLVVGVMIYLMPLQQVRADTTTSGMGSTDSRTSTARITVPVEWAFASATIGFILLALGLISSNPGPTSGTEKHTFEKVVDSEDSSGDKTTRIVVRDRMSNYEETVDEDSD